MLTNRSLFLVESALPDKYFRIDLSEYSVGINETKDHFFKMNDDRKVEWVISRVCDHANGKLARKDCASVAKCPVHGWTLDLEKLQYTNVQINKKKLDFIQEDHFLLLESNEKFIKVPENIKTAAANEISIRFLSHAALAITIDGFTIVTDPWLVGPCFMTGWWHKIIPKSDAIEVMKNADLIYISHNHPDHMHMETLSYLQKSRPDIPIIVPNFSSESVVRPLTSYGFTNLIPLFFNQIYSVDGKKILLSILKSGDFRDDSGLFFMSGKFSGLLTVDAAALNNMILPRNIDFLATAFAGGASGFPWCFDHYSIDEREQISTRSRKAIIKHTMDYIKATSPKNYMPYAGYFSEEANRDDFIKLNNKKNSVNDIKIYLSKAAPEVNFINPIETDLVRFDPDGGIKQKESIKLDFLYTMNESYVNGYLDNERKCGSGFDINLVAEYFLLSKFRDDLIVYLLPTNDKFESLSVGLKIDFSNIPLEVSIMDSNDLLTDYDRVEEIRRKVIRVRQDALWSVVVDRLSWEELSIGFQCRIVRRPDVYNSRFWEYFTNVYTNI